MVGPRGLTGQPDLALLKPRKDFYREALPTAADTLLAIEVADTTYGYDHDVKVPLYARKGIPESWIVDISGEAIDVFRTPSSRGHRKASRLGRGRVVHPTAFADVAVAVNDDLGLT